MSGWLAGDNSGAGFLHVGRAITSRTRYPRNTRRGLNGDERLAQRRKVADRLGLWCSCDANSLPKIACAVSDIGL